MQFYLVFFFYSHEGVMRVDTRRRQLQKHRIVIIT